MKRKNIFKGKAKENFLKLQGRCRKGRGGEQRKRLGDQARGGSNERAMLWKKCGEEKNKALHGKQKERGMEKKGWPELCCKCSSAELVPVSAGKEPAKWTCRLRNGEMERPENFWDLTEVWLVQKKPNLKCQFDHTVLYIYLHHSPFKSIAYLHSNMPLSHTGM